MENNSRSKRFGLYLSNLDDPCVIKELNRRGNSRGKGAVLRSYALLGYQRARNLCDQISDANALTKALGQLFAPEGAPPDFRLARQFINIYVHSDKTDKAEKTGSSNGRQQPSSPPPVPSAPQKLTQTRQSGPKPKVSPTGTNDWSSLSSLVGVSSSAIADNP